MLWRSSANVTVYGFQSAVNISALPQSSLQASAPLVIVSSQWPPSGAVFASLMLRRTDTGALLLLPQNEMPLYMLRSYVCLTFVPPSVSEVLGPRSVPMPAPQVMKPLPVMHIAYVLS